MKALLYTVLVVAALFGLAYLAGLFEMEDPEVAAANFKAQVTPGMDWTAVVAIRRPRKYVYYSPDPNGFGMLERGPFDFSEDAVKPYAQGGGGSQSFGFPYQFSAGLETSEHDAFVLVFDNAGKFLRFEDVMTFSDLLKTAGGGG